LQERLTGRSLPQRLLKRCMVRTTNPALQERLDTLVRLANENNVDEVRPWAG
jgi:hypothetical protein